MKKIFVFTAVFLSLALSTAPAFARTSLIGTHGRHGRTTTTVSNTQTAATATQTTTSTVTPATVNTTLPSTATAVGTTVLAREVAASVLVNGIAITGPVLYYKDMYYVPLEHLKNLNSEYIT